jgi:hypothetical protein
LNSWRGNVRKKRRKRRIKNLRNQKKAPRRVPKLANEIVVPVQEVETKIGNLNPVKVLRVLEGSVDHTQILAAVFLHLETEDIQEARERVTSQQRVINPVKVTSPINQQKVNNLFQRNSSLHLSNLD